MRSDSHSNALVFFGAMQLAVNSSRVPTHEQAKR
jgi:hypothetical protein